MEQSTTNIMDSHSFYHISRMLSSKKTLNIILKIYTPSKLIKFCRVAESWIRTDAPTPENARELFKELQEKFTEDEYPELWI